MEEERRGKGGKKSERVVGKKRRAGGRKEEGVMCNTHNYYTQLCVLQILCYVYNVCYTDRSI